MTTFFRLSPGDPNDLGLLPAGLRDNGDLATIADEAEARVLAHYTKTERDPECLSYILDASYLTPQYVWIKGYDPDPLKCNTAMLAALRREIAGVIRWVHAQWKREADITSETHGDPMTSKQYRTDAEAMLPPTFGRALDRFAIRRIPGVI